VVALKSEEVEGKTATYLMVFTTEGHIILPELKVGDHKYEGIEFL
jgi:soluble calcium-activated nucleotidase 1